MAGEKPIGDAVTLLRPEARSDIFLICDHASNLIPSKYANLGVGAIHRRDHVAWDIGAADVTRVLSEELAAPAVLGATSRLVVDFNRQPDAADVIPALSHGVRIPGNENLGDEERESRFRRYYRPYHETIDRLLAASPAALLLSVHSFSHDLDRARRDFDVGVLFDEHEALARSFAERLTAAGLDTRLNEPYSGRSDVISSAQAHGLQHRRAHFEIEIDQRRLGSRSEAVEFGRRLVPVVAALAAAAREERSP